MLVAAKIAEMLVAVACCVHSLGAHAKSLLLPVLCLCAAGWACYQPKYHVTTPNASDLPGRGYRHIVCYPRFGACFPVHYFWSPWFVRVRNPCSAASNSGVSAAGCTRFLNLLLKSCFFLLQRFLLISQPTVNGHGLSRPDLI